LDWGALKKLTITWTFLVARRGVVADRRCIAHI